MICPKFSCLTWYRLVQYLHFRVLKFALSHRMGSPTCHRDAEAIAPAAVLLVLSVGGRLKPTAMVLTFAAGKVIFICLVWVGLKRV